MNDETHEETASEESAPEWGQTFLQQVFDLWVTPEIERRKNAGTLPGDFDLRGAQVIMNVGEPNIVRLNDEVRAVMITKLKGGSVGLQNGDPVYWDQIEGIDEIHLTDQDPNAGHVTILRVGSGWAINFDFRYNASRVRELLDAANEFFEAAESARFKNHQRAFMENLFAATELTAHARLMFEPDERILGSKKHSFIAAKINHHGHMGNVDRAFVALLNDLIRQRGTARYVAGRVDLDPSRMEEMASVVKCNLESLKSGAPKRYPSSIGPSTVEATPVAAEEPAAPSS
ncbi:hypothetical protein AKJ09_02426 [Labilithrix luteola]|uniref:Uncharacterized protein n=1 Tax=Labilithrix luteola TaxID=1391654 RepID=A0A0K1PQG6_9BACT|nr:hypothetical protein [Labilithrix luteola]AKU95762.1 hypothetical protein AKJ09_02426 [Labilithrix luteola]